MTRSRKKPFPETIVVLGHQIKVTVCEIDDGADGDFSDAKMEIRINQDQSEEKKHEALFHETVHAVWHLSGWSHAMKDEEEEGLTRAIEHGLWPLVKWRN